MSLSKKTFIFLCLSIILGMPVTQADTISKVVAVCSRDDGLNLTITAAVRENAIVPYLYVVSSDQDHARAAMILNRNEGTITLSGTHLEKILLAGEYDEKNRIVFSGSDEIAYKFAHMGFNPNDKSSVEKISDALAKAVEPKTFLEDHRFNGFYIFPKTQGGYGLALEGFHKYRTETVNFTRCKIAPELVAMLKVQKSDDAYGSLRSETTMSAPKTTQQAR